VAENEKVTSAAHAPLSQMNEKMNETSAEVEREM